MWVGGDVIRFRGGLVFKAHSLVYHSTLGFRVMKKKKKVGGCFADSSALEASLPMTLPSDAGTIKTGLDPFTSN